MMNLHLALPILVLALVLVDGALVKKQVTARVVQMNIYKTGQFETSDHEDRRNWRTALSGGGLLKAIGADAVGIQEVDLKHKGTLLQKLKQATGAKWQCVYSQQGVRKHEESGVGVFWRTDRVKLVRDLGGIVLGELAHHYVIKAHGAILSKKGKKFAMFTTKLNWGEPGKSKVPGQTIDEEEERLLEARRLMSWMTRLAKTEFRKHRVRTYLLAIDLNDKRGSDTYKLFKRAFDDGDGKKNTFSAKDPNRRIDFLFFRDAAGKVKLGFKQKSPPHSDGRLGRSMNYGSDHRFIYGDVVLL
jgi:endonuclease/exonuclease/phosphatase family metal-dependent hydrolase